MSNSHSGQLSFWVNNMRHVVPNPDPRELLLDYLRSDQVGLTGTKKVCAQGGCGACTVLLSQFNPLTQQVEQRAVNSCLRPLCAVDGMAVTTVEGVGKTERLISPVQYQLAIDNGSQCGYCTPGWVMSMHSWLVANPGRQCTQQEIEDLFDGNLCRCTGFRPILFAMGKFATLQQQPPPDGTMTCCAVPGTLPAVASTEPNLLPTLEAPTAFRVEKDGYTWIRVLTLDALLAVLAQYGSEENLKLVVGNTAIGVYGVNDGPSLEVKLGPPHWRVDISHVPELHGSDRDAAGFSVGAATTYTRFLELLDDWLAEVSAERRIGLEALRYMAQRTAGRIVRDVASLAGNTMLVVRHIEKGTPFPSDMFTALCVMGATIEVIRPEWPLARRLPILEFARLWCADAAFQKDALILRYNVPWSQKREWARTYKVALREVNAHSIVNAGLRIRFAVDQTVSNAAVVYGGIGPVAFTVGAVEDWLVGRRWDAETLTGALERVKAAVWERISATRARMAEVPDEGFTDSYRAHMAESFFYQFFLWVAEQVAPGLVPPDLVSAGVRTRLPPSSGTQSYRRYPDEYPVNQPYVKAEAFLQVTGEAVYPRDTPLPARGVEGAFVLSTRALANFHFRLPGADASAVALATLCDALRAKFPGFIDLVVASDIPIQARNNQASAGEPTDYLLCVDSTTACGQALAIALARDAQQAIDIAWWVQSECVAYSAIPDVAGVPSEPVLTLEEAIEKKNFLITNNIFMVTRKGSTFDWRGQSTATVDGVVCRVVSGAQMSRTPQMHFYMETQSAVATPGEGGRMTVLSSTQNPGTVLSSVMGALGLPSNMVEVQVTRVGGGYGGKGPRTPWAATNTAIAAAKTGRPVKIATTRATDSALFGHENPLLGQWSIAVGTGEDDPANAGRLMGADLVLYMDAGSTADCSAVVMDCVQLRGDNGYFVPNYESKGWVCLTNTASNTSFRSLDALSGIIILEDGLEAAAHEIGLLPENVRAKNLYQLGDFTPYGEALEYCYLADVWKYTRARSDFDHRLEAVRAFNRHNRWKKRGISLLPIKYGMGFNATFLERGDALVDIYSGDGTVLVRHGGAEIGQGLNTQVIQLVAQALNIPMSLVRTGTTSTAVIPNPISTGASTGAAFNGGAAQKAAARLCKRLQAYCIDQLNQFGPAACKEKNLDFWNYETGWNTPLHAGGLLWNKIVSAASEARINLSTQAQHNESGGNAADTGIANHASANPGDQNFVGYTYSAACSEVEVDILTGEVSVLRADLVYDMGKSINPAIDVGQIEGAFVQGIGRVLLEDLVWQPTGEAKGTNNTPNTWGYKIPATTTVPREMHVDLYPRESSAEVPENPNLLMSAKEVGEPPLCMAATVYFAVKHALLDSRTERGKAGWFRLDMPCTVQRVREACDVEIVDLDIGDAVQRRDQGPGAFRPSATCSP